MKNSGSTLAKFFLILATLVFEVSANAIAKKHHELSKTRWIEVQRTDTHGKDVSYTDTLFLKVEGPSIQLRKNGFMYSGKTTKDSIDFDDATFAIKRNKHEIVLIGSSYSHIFKRDVIRTEAADYARVKKEDKIPNHPVTAIHPSWLNGTWFVFKRKYVTSHHANIDYKTQIKRVDVKTNTEGVQVGSVSTFEGKQPHFTITKIKGPYFYLKDAKGVSSKLTLYQLTKTDMVFDDGNELRYFLKKE